MVRKEASTVDIKKMGLKFFSRCVYLRGKKEREKKKIRKKMCKHSVISKVS